MKHGFGSLLLAVMLVLALTVPAFAQSTETSAPQDDEATSKVFLPLVASTNAQADVADEELPAEALLSEEALIQQYAAQVQASAVVATNGKIAFSSNIDGDADIYTMNPDGTGLVNLTNTSQFGTLHETDPKWSPDGTKIAFVFGLPLNSAGATQGFIVVMNADGTNPTFLTLSNTGGGTDAQPEWSPDGTKIAFSTRREVTTISTS